MFKKRQFIFLTVVATLLIFVYQITLTSVNHYPYHPKTLITNSTGNFPDLYFRNYTNPKELNKTCAIFPHIFDIRIKNNNWQMQETSSGTFLLFSAYLDLRRQRLVRILGTYSQKLPKETFFCQFWYEDSEKPVIVKSEVLFWLFHEKWGADDGYFDHPYLITCPLGENKVPTSVSLVENRCDNATNNLKVNAKEVEKKNFVVCVKGLSFPYEDKSTRLVEWIELLNILGAEKINFYEFAVHPRNKQILNYYVEKGKIEVTPLTLTGDVSNRPYLQSLYLKTKMIERRLQEVIPYNDCLYKHLQEFKYVVLLDTDEVIVPVRDTWVELMNTLQSLQPQRSSYIARNVYFLDVHQHDHEWFESVPKYMHMLQHVYRAKEYTKLGFYVKGFHDTEKVIALHNHFPRGCFEACKHADIDVSYAHLQHYRSDCVKGLGDCESMKVNSVVDKRVWNYKDELVERVERTFSDLGIFQD